MAVSAEINSIRGRGQGSVRFSWLTLWLEEQQSHKLSSTLIQAATAFTKFIVQQTVYRFLPRACHISVLLSLPLFFLPLSLLLSLSLSLSSTFFVSLCSTSRSLLHCSRVQYAPWRMIRSALSLPALAWLSQLAALYSRVLLRDEEITSSRLWLIRIAHTMKAVAVIILSSFSGPMLPDQWNPRSSPDPSQIHKSRMYLNEDPTSKSKKFKCI